MARTNLKLFRVAKRMSQQDIADKIGIARATYASVEAGKRNGKHKMWLTFQKAFDIPDNAVWGLMKLDE